ncbi:MAG: hypothetical protein ACOYLB_09860 [Phototrophicaceae bacterium]
MSTLQQDVYTIHQLSAQLVYIKWHKNPPICNEFQNDFLSKLKALLDQAEGKLFFVSDLRAGRIHDAKFIRKLALLLTNHPQYGGSTSFAMDTISRTLVSVFTLTSRRGYQTEIHPNAESAFDYIESLCPSILHGVNWQAVVDGEA